MYMDNIANTNFKNQDLFDLVVRDAPGEINVGDLSILSCEKILIFTELHCYFLCFLYGEHTLS